MKRIFAIVLIIGLVFSLNSCSLWYESINNGIDNFDVGYSKRLKKAFLADYNWDGAEDTMNIVIPEAYEKAPITGLGGSTGRGVPCPFMVSPTDEACVKLCPYATEWMYTSNISKIEINEIKYLRFSLSISKYISEIDNIWMDCMIVAVYEENGQKIYNVYILTFYVTCDEDNETFYAKDGKLYYRESDTLVEGITYEDFDLNKHLEDGKDDYVLYHPF